MNLGGNILRTCRLMTYQGLVMMQVGTMMVSWQPFSDTVNLNEKSVGGLSWVCLWG